MNALLFIVGAILGTGLGAASLVIVLGPSQQVPTDPDSR